MSHSRRQHQPLRFRAGTIVLLAWFLLALAGSLVGAFDSGQRPPLLLGAAAVLPVVVFAIAYRASVSLRRFVAGADVRVLTAVQTWRLVGVVFLVLHQRGALPGAFAIPAGWGDIAIGATAPLVAWMLATGRLARPAFVLWNLLGILDLVMAITLGVLSSASPIGILAGDVTTQVMGTFPLSLIPTFFVPLTVILHAIALLSRRGAALRSPALSSPTAAGTAV